MKRYWPVLVLLLSAAWFISTGSSCAPTSSAPSGYSTASLTHWGFDFATGKATDEVGVYDGETINWNPDGVETVVGGVTYESHGPYIWWRGEYGALSSTPYQKHIGTGNLSSVTSVPTTWDSMTVIAVNASVVRVILVRADGKLH